MELTEPKELIFMGMEWWGGEAKGGRAQCKTLL
jgi:hypothetical protein